MSEPTLPYESKADNHLPAGKRICPRCDGSMTLGFIPDITLGGALDSIWIQGRTPIGIWKVWKMRKRPSYYIDAYRCDQCGALDLFALRRKM